MNNDILLKGEKLTKIFPGVVANDEIDFDLKKGEVHILVGENGAGKSTLSKMILGVYTPNKGKLFLNGEEVSFKNPQEALSKGIVGVYQEFTLIPHLNVYENIFLNREKVNRLGLVNKKQLIKDAKEILASLNSEDIDVNEIVCNLTVAKRQIVEIAKALSYQPKIIVFDEPTSALSENEVESLFVQINKLKKRGIGIIYISHRMDEFPLIGDRITVMRDGRKIDTFNIEDHSQEEVVNMMVGRDISQVFPKNKCKRGAQRLSVEHLKDTTGFVKDVSFNLHSGEIVGLSGLVGSGRTESVEMIFGIRKIESGDIFVDGEKVVPKNPRHMINKGISLIPEDRKKQGLALKDKIKWNIGQVVLHEKFPTNVIIEPKVDSLACEYVEKLRIACIDVNSVCQKLSGGNQQKVVLAKWLVCNSNIIIFDEPTRGIDVGAKLEIYQIMCDLANQGKAVLCISSELSEILGMCNRVYVFNEGEVIGEIDKNEKNFSAEGIGEMMLLSKEKLS